MRAAIGELIPIMGVKAACEALDFPRASFYRKRGLEGVSPVAAVRFVPRALVSAERETVLACLHEERFQNCAPAAIYATLLDEGHYHCSIRTMYRTRYRSEPALELGHHETAGAGEMDVLLSLRDPGCF